MPVAVWRGIFCQQALETRYADAPLADRPGGLFKQGLIEHCPRIQRVDWILPVFWPASYGRHSRCDIHRTPNAPKQR